MASELAQAIQEVCDDKKIPLESVIQTIESALAAAYRKDFGNKMQNIKVEFDMETGAFKVFDIKEVVEDELQAEYERIKEEKMKQAEEEAAAEGKEAEVKKEAKPERVEEEEIAEDEDVKRFNPKTMISLSEAKEIKKKIKLGEELIQELEVGGEFGRMAAQTAKQVVIQKLREAERNTILEEYRDKIGDLLTGTVQRVEGRVILVDFGNTTAVMPLEEGVRSEKYVPGARFKFYVKNVEESSRGPKVIVSRTHPDILRKLFKLEVPEIASGTVQIKSIAREAGSRSKIAVAAKEDSLDPIGACVGQRGTRVQTIINEIGGEKIDIIEWEEDPIKFIAKALAPAKIIKVEIKGGDKKKEEEEGPREAIVHVAADQLSLAIGKEGQNVRLAAKLTGWKIDIVGDELEEEKQEIKEEVKEEKKEDKKEKKEEKKEKKEDKKEKVKKEDKEEDKKEEAKEKEKKEEKKEEKKDK
jgi:N utilization substance protein A